MKRLKEIISTAKSTGTISEKDILLLKNRLNKGHDTSDKIWEFINNLDEGLVLEKEHSRKGIDFLYNLYKTPMGKIRKNNPFGSRECEILDFAKNSEEANFTFDGFRDSYKFSNSVQFPVYTLHSEVLSMSYFYDGEVNIIW